MKQPSLDDLLKQRVVLDTQGPMIYIGRLEAYDEHGYWLTDADVHDRNDGHSTKEVYVNQAHELEATGVRRTNRRRVFVERRAIISISALDDVVTDDQTAEDGDWTP
jgi:small nuclear ribonucleoprotein (snRNP)-like protein